MYESSGTYNNPDSIMTANEPVPYRNSIPQKPEPMPPLTAIAEKLKGISNENFDLVMRLHESLVGTFGGKPACLDAPADRSTFVGDISGDLQIACGINEVIRSLYERLGLSM